MRDNGPVTQHEIFMADGSAIVSRTDDKGRIQFVNKDFVDLAGYSYDELIGQPHNVIRHRDMPPRSVQGFVDRPERRKTMERLRQKPLAER